MNNTLISTIQKVIAKNSNNFKFYPEFGVKSICKFIGIKPVITGFYTDYKGICTCLETGADITELFLFSGNFSLKYQNSQGLTIKFLCNRKGITNKILLVQLTDKSKDRVYFTVDGEIYDGLGS
jgi:hypothetical protein